MFFKMLTLVVLLFVTNAIGQEDEIQLGDSYDLVVSKIRKDILFVDKNILILEENEILYSMIWDKLILDKYIFTAQGLKTIINIVSRPDAKKMLSFFYQLRVENQGQPEIVYQNNIKMYAWKQDEKTLIYFYIDFVDWFQKDCFISKITIMDE